MDNLRKEVALPGDYPKTKILSRSEYSTSPGAQRKSNLIVWLNSFLRKS